jgi:CDP-6-deoxy-D-xylo-4-hexulose-3-dehydrase
MKNSNVKDRQRLKTLVKKIWREKTGNLWPAKNKIGVSWPVYDEKEILRAFDSLVNLRLSQGPSVREFELSYARAIGRKYAVAVNSGSSANLIALSALLISGDLKKGDEVIIPASTFATVASPIIQVGLIPVYVDIDPKTWNISPGEIERAISPKTKLLMPVHSLGNPADMKAIMKIARQHKIKVLEDCCEAHGASINGKAVGTFGDLATISFFVAHNITTGEGGMVFTNDKKIYDILTSVREFGRLPKEIVDKERFIYKDKILGRYDTRQIFYRLGYNVRMTDIAAALGIEQLKKLNSLNKIRTRITTAYSKALSKYEKYITLPYTAPGNFHSFYGYCVMIKKGVPFSRLDIVRFLEGKGIETRPFFGGCLPDQPAFRDEPKRIVGNLPVARWIRDNAVFIGCHPALTKKHVRHVINSFAAFFEQYD